MARPREVGCLSCIRGQREDPVLPQTPPGHTRGSFWSNDVDTRRRRNCCPCFFGPWSPQRGDHWFRQVSPLTPFVSPLLASPSSHASQRIQTMVEQGTTFLNRGLGAMNVRTRRTLPTKRGILSSPSNRVLLMGLLMTIPAAVSIEFHDALGHREYILTTDQAARSEGCIRLAGIPITCAAVNCLVTHIRRTTFWWERYTPQTWYGCDPLSSWPMLLATLGLLRAAILKIIIQSTADHIAYYIDMFMALMLLRIYYALLDQIDAIIQGMRHEQEVINSTKPVKKMQDLVRNITRSGRAEKDSVYCFEQTNTVPAAVLSYVWWFYYIVGKIIGAGLMLAFCMGFQASLISHFLIGGVLFSAATASGFMFELGPNTLSLFRLCLNKPFYVGDLVTLNADGAMDAPATSIMGFVENITMMYVVIRNFEMKQTWIPHSAFGKLIIQNWTRRPSKTVLLNIGVSCRCPVKKVEQLTAFGKKWIQESQEIQQTNYQKCHITSTANGYNIEIIFFPAIGVSHRGIRQKFLIAFMSVAEKLQVPFVPVQLQQNFCDQHAACHQDASGFVFEDSAFDEFMPDPEDRLPKGVGLGFRQFPGSKTNLAGFVVNVQDSTAHSQNGQHAGVHD